MRNCRNVDASEFVSELATRCVHCCGEYTVLDALKDTLDYFECGVALVAQEDWDYGFSLLLSHGYWEIEENG